MATKDINRSLSIVMTACLVLGLTSSSLQAQGRIERVEPARSADGAYVVGAGAVRYAIRIPADWAIGATRMLPERVVLTARKVDSGSRTLVSMMFLEYASVRPKSAVEIAANQRRDAVRECPPDSVPDLPSVKTADGQTAYLVLACSSGAGSMSGPGATVTAIVDTTKGNPALSMTQDGNGPLGREKRVRDAYLQEFQSVVRSFRYLPQWVGLARKNG